MREATMNGFQEHGYRITWSLTHSELRKVSELRADVFCRELRWTGSPEDCVEQDEFDTDSTHIAVLDVNSEVIGAVRLINSRAPWMLDTVFRGLVTASWITKGSNTAEVSRLAVNRRWRGRCLGNGRRVCDLLYKAAYAYCRTNGIRYLYMVISDIVLEHMRRSGLPCQRISVPRQMSDGVRAVTVVLDWNRMHEIRMLADWYESGWQMSPTSQRNAVEHGPPLIAAGSWRHPVAATSAKVLPATGADGAPAEAPAARLDAERTAATRPQRSSASSGHAGARSSPTVHVS